MRLLGVRLLLGAHLLLLLILLLVLRRRRTRLHRGSGALPLIDRRPPLLPLTDPRSLTASADRRALAVADSAPLTPTGIDHASSES